MRFASIWGYTDICNGCSLNVHFFIFNLLKAVCAIFKGFRWSLAQYLAQLPHSSSGCSLNIVFLEEFKMYIERVGQTTSDPIEFTKNTIFNQHPVPLYSWMKKKPLQITLSVHHYGLKIFILNREVRVEVCEGLKGVA